jgi:hypothetical protein
MPISNRTDADPSRFCYESLPNSSNMHLMSSVFTQIERLEETFSNDMNRVSLLVFNLDHIGTVRAD